MHKGPKGKTINEIEIELTRQPEGREAEARSAELARNCAGSTERTKGSAEPEQAQGEVLSSRGKTSARRGRRLCCLDEVFAEVVDFAICRPQTQGRKPIRVSDYG